MVSKTETVSAHTQDRTITVRQHKPKRTHTMESLKFLEPIFFFFPCDLFIF